MKQEQHSLALNCIGLFTTILVVYLLQQRRHNQTCQFPTRHNNVQWAATISGNIQFNEQLAHAEPEEALSKRGIGIKKQRSNQKLEYNSEKSPSLIQRTTGWPVSLKFHIASWAMIHSLSNVQRDNRNEFFEFGEIFHRKKEMNFPYSTVFHRNPPLSNSSKFALYHQLTSSFEKPPMNFRSLNLLRYSLKQTNKKILIFENFM